MLVKCDQSNKVMLTVVHFLESFKFKIDVRDENQLEKKHVKRKINISIILKICTHMLNLQCSRKKTLRWDLGVTRSPLYMVLHTSHKCKYIPLKMTKIFYLVCATSSPPPPPPPTPSTTVGSVAQLSDLVIGHSCHSWVQISPQEFFSSTIKTA